jgi:hypothetical protein
VQNLSLPLDLPSLSSPGGNNNNLKILGCEIDISFDVIIEEPDIIKYNLLPVLLFCYGNMNSNSNANIKLVSSDVVDKSIRTCAVFGEFRIETFALSFY